jgi:hypothetical protein
MLARLGNVIYWAACAVAALIAIGAVFVFINDTDKTEKWTLTAIYGGIGIFIWLAGLACRYVLRGPNEKA